MDQDTVKEQHEIQTEAQRTRKQLTTAGPEPGPGASCVSFRSDQSKDAPMHFKGAPSTDPQCVSAMDQDTVKEQHEIQTEAQRTRKQLTTAGPEPGPGASCVSFRSDQSKDAPMHFKGAPSTDPHSLEGVDGSSAAEPDSIFTLLEDNIITFVKAELKHLQKIVAGDDPECSGTQMEGEDEEQRRNREAFLTITLDFLKRMKQEELAERLQSRTKAPRYRHELKSNLKKKFQYVSEGVAKAGSPTLLKEIFTELYITKGGNGEVNQEHEVIQIETASRRSDAAGTAIRREELFKSPPGRPRPIRTVMTKGVAGIGKTLLTHKFTVDWAEGKIQQEVHFTFPLTFRELNLLRGRSFSLVGLVHHFFSGSKGAGICNFQDFLVLFILDGLDECRLPLDFLSTKTLTDVSESTSVEVLLINLIRGELLPSARLWITTRPAAANQIPPECVDMVTEVRGFTDPQKEEYFRRKSTDEEQVSMIMSHIRRCRSLHIMCHIPLFCWITATVLEDVLKSRKEGELPRTLTQIYSHYVVLQTKVKTVKFDDGAATDPHWSPQSRKMMESLGKLAFEQLQKGNVIFYESDLTECGMDIRAASVCSGVFTQVSREESSLYQDKVFIFIHLSLQEFLAALHVHQTFISSKVNLLEHQPQNKNSLMLTIKQTFSNHEVEPDLNLLHQSAVDEALRSPNGHLDMFLRFLLGLSLSTNQKLLQGLLTQTGSDSQTNQRTVKYIKEKLTENLSAERSINLFHCLNEVNDHSLLEQIQQSMRSGCLSTEELSPAQWSALVFILLSSQEHLDVFDLKSFSPSEEAFLKLLSVAKASKNAELSFCGLSERSCAALSSVLSSQSSSVTHLDLSNNHLQDSGVKLLCEGLQNPHCKLDSLRLSFCGLSERSCAALSSVLSSQSFILKHLDLSNNHLQDSGVELLCEGLKSPHCKLDSLSLSGCLITEVGGASLAAALSSNSSSVRELDLSYNHPGDSAVKLLSQRLNTLRADHGGERRIKAGLRKYFCHIDLDTNSINTNLRLSENNRTVTRVKQEELYPYHHDRFDYYQVLCSSGLTGRCYWEVERNRDVYIAVSYRGIRRKGNSVDCWFGFNNQSWSLDCYDGFYSFRHNNRVTPISCPCPSSGRVGVYVDCPAGRLSFYEVSSDSLRLIHTVCTSFTDTLYPGFRIGSIGSSVSLCPL
ncbi:NLR family CARD domain-containing protein 3-like [Gouania willdenowi]|uniref:NLR family CARD domain-containing protein 3-like n=1 Tax=Gouania willdenowi TaxID=441366 RepID=A0A8C5EBM7_GOUWI|nr:NLR family CARD domain-containing protein 3-like [Gouania willdenowi]